MSLLPNIGAKWLPEEATNISYYQRRYGIGAFRDFEFTVSKEGLLKWAKESNYPVEKITDYPFAIRRYTRNIKKYYNVDTDNMSAEEFDKYFYNTLEKKIKSGYKYEKRYGNGGGTSVGFDLDESRAYFQYSHN